MESNTRSPIYSDFGELLEGIVTVRAFSVERRFLNNLHKKVDVTTKVSTRRASTLLQASSTIEYIHTDVVFLLDDQSLAMPKLRRTGGVRHSDNYTVLNQGSY